MASIGKDKNGRKRILFVDKDGKRQTVRLGKLTLRLAEEVKNKIEAVNAAIIAGVALDGDTARWLAGLGDDLAGKLAAVGLIPRRGSMFLGEFLDNYTASRTDLKPGSRTNLTAARRNLVEFFGADKNLRDITAGDADSWVLFLRDKGLAPPTISLRLKRAKQFFRAASRRKLVPENPFIDLKSLGEGNESRKFFVSREVGQKVLDACPDAEWRCIVALSRYGGLRCPSETLSLKLTDVDWERERVTITSPKTEHLPDGANRQIPLFPELRPYLEEVFDAAAAGTVYFINRFRDATQNLRTQFLRIIRRAGVQPWPRLFHNLRASRETELAEQFPIHVVCSWIGNTEKIAARHYLQTTDAYFDRAVQRGTESGTVKREKAAQKAAQQDVASCRTEPQDVGLDREKQGSLQSVATCCENTQDGQMTPTGFEPVSRP
jgi:integrase